MIGEELRWESITEIASKGRHWGRSCQPLINLQNQPIVHFLIGGDHRNLRASRNYLSSKKADVTRVSSVSHQTNHHIDISIMKLHQKLYRGCDAQLKLRDQFYLPKPVTTPTKPPDLQLLFVVGCPTTEPLVSSPSPVPFRALVEYSGKNVHFLPGMTRVVKERETFL